MSSLPILSDKVFDVALLTPLTNEIPHLSIYNILNRQLRTTWSRELVGKSTAGYTVPFESQKIMNDNLSRNYSAKEVTFTDPETDTIYNVKFEKINLSVDGALETEIDYLMHENARYLSKLYPEDLNSILTLTEAERQSYFNEALHMVHSYFDTEQIVMDLTELSIENQKVLDEIGLSLPNYQLITDMYFRHKFLTGITPIRALTGVAQQEESLLNLLNTGKVAIYSGFNILSTPNEDFVISNTTQNKDIGANLNFNAYYALSKELMQSKSAVRFHGKIQSDSLKDMLTDTTFTLSVDPVSLDTNCKLFTVLDTSDPLALLEDFISGTTFTDFELNPTFLQATKENVIKPGAPITTLYKTEFAKTRKIAWKSDDDLYPVFSHGAINNQISLYNKDTSPRNPIDLEEKIIINKDVSLSTIDNTTFLKLGYSEYNDESLYEIGNLVFNYFVKNYIVVPDFKSAMDIALTSKLILLQASIYQEGQLVFSGIMDVDYLNTLNLKAVPGTVSYKYFSDSYHANLLFTAKDFQSNIKNLFFDISKPMSIEFRTIKIPSENFRRNSNAFEDTIGSIEYTILTTQGTDGDVLVNVVHTRMQDQNTKKDVLWDENTNEYYYIDENGDRQKAEPVETTIIYTGNTSSKKLVESTNITNQVGTLNKVGNLFYLKIGEEPEKVYKFPDISLQREIEAEIVDNSINKKIGRAAICEIRGETYFNSENIDLLKATNTSSLDSLYSFTTELEEKDVLGNVLTSTESSVNTLYITIEYYETLLDLILNNSESFVNTYTSSTEAGAEYYIYATSYKVLSLVYKTPESLLTILNLSKVFFQGETSSYYKLITCPVEFYADNILKTRKDLTEIIERLGVANCLILDNYGNFHGGRAKKTKIKNDYCYIEFEDNLTGLSTLENKEGVLILDPKLESDSGDSNEDLEMERRSVVSKEIYKFSENLRYYQEISWENLKKEHLNFNFNNIFSDTVNTTYADDTNLSRKTVIPQSLGFLENLTLLDANSSVNLEVFKDLINENKSLYLDSSLRFLVNVPLVVKMLVHNSEYDTLSYVYSSDIPSYITLYQYDDWESYEPLKDFLDSIQDSETITLTTIETQVSRRLVIWGRVVWDANDNSRSIKVLRTIWSSYFSNFEIFQTDDILPPESLLQSGLNNDSFSQKTINIQNYNYAENGGTADADWILSNTVYTGNTEKLTVNVVDAFSHKEVAEDTLRESESFKIGAENSLNTIFLNTFTFTSNRCELSQTGAISSILTTNSVYLEKINLDVNIELKKLPGQYLTAKYNTLTKSYEFTVSGVSKELLLIYGMPHLSGGNFSSLGFFENMFSSIPLQMFLEYCVFLYYNLVILKAGEGQDFEDFLSTVQLSSKYTTARIRDYLKLFVNKVSDPEKDSVNSLNLKDILNFIYETFSNFQTAKYVPCIGNLDSKGKLKIYYYLIEKKDQNTFLISEGSLTEFANGDLMNNLLGNSVAQSFQVPSNLFTTYSEAFNKYQYTLPENAEGLPKNIQIDLLFDIKAGADNNITLVPSSDRILEAFGEELLVQELETKNKFLETYRSENKVESKIADTMQNLLNPVQYSKLQLDKDTIILNNERTFRFSDTSKKFKECYTANISFSTQEPSSEKADIRKCVMTFEQPFDFKNQGYLYLKDIKVPNRRSNYTLARETQILDRSCKLNDLHIIGCKENEGLELLLQDSSRSYVTQVMNAVDLIKPVDDSLNTQEVTDTALKLGFKWADPGREIGYTFYKRKCVFEGIVNPLDPTLITLADSELADNEDFDLTKHASSGDQVQIILTDSSSYFKAGGTITLDFSKEGYTGPYKVIHTITAAKNNDEATCYVILSGLGNLVQVEIPLQEGSSVTIKDPLIFDLSASYSAFTLSDGKILYQDTKTQSTVYVADVPSYTNGDNSLKLLTPTVIQIPAEVNADAENIEELEDGTFRINLATKLDVAKEDPLVGKHKEWYAFSETKTNLNPLEDEDDTSEESSDEGASDYNDIDGSFIEDFPETLEVKEAPTSICESVLLDSGRLNYDNYDRLFFEPDSDMDDSYTSWTALPDKVEYFPTSVSNTFEIINEEDATKTSYDVDTANEDTLRTFIRNTLKDMFESYTTIEGEIDSSAIKAELKLEFDSEGNPIEIDKEALENLVQRSETGFILGQGSAADMAVTAFARLLSHKNMGSTWTPSTEDVYLPKIEEHDIPVYMRDDVEKPKWQKAYVFSGQTNTTLNSADVDQLRNFAKVLLPFENVYRNSPSITSTCKNSKHLICWDQNTSSLTVLDTQGNLIRRQSIKELAIEHPVLSNGVTLDIKGNKKYTNALAKGNYVYTYGSTGDLKNYYDKVSTLLNIQVGTSKYNIYSIFGLETITGILKFNANAPLYLPELLKPYKNYDWENNDSLGGEAESIKKFMQAALDPDTFESWMTENFMLDFCNAAVLEYASFKKNQGSINLNILGKILSNFTELSEQESMLDKVLDFTNLAIERALTKGLPFSTSDSTKLVAMPTSNLPTRNFESLIEYSSISIDDSDMIKVYGRLDWPDLDSVKENVKASLLNLYPNNLNISTDSVENAIQIATDQTILEIQNKYRTFYGTEEYAPGNKSFLLFVDANEGKVNIPQQDWNYQDNSVKIQAIIGSDIIAGSGMFEAPDSSANVFSIDPSSFNNFESTLNESSSLSVLDSLKNLDILSGMQIQKDLTAKITLNGSLVSNPDSFYTKVSYVNPKELKIQSNILNLDSGDEVHVVVLIRSYSKDNFQLGYGKITKPELIVPSDTLFEVSSSYNADFVSYDNKGSSPFLDSELGMQVNTSVFDLYPTFEKVDEEKKEYFYMLDSSKNLKYLKNSNGRDIIRISPLSGGTGGRIIFNIDPKDFEGLTTATKKTVANEWIDYAFLKEVSEEGVRVNKVLLTDSRLLGKDYETFVKQYSYQKVPEIVSNAWNAVVTYTYRSLTIPLKEKGMIEIYEDYLKLKVPTEGSFISELKALSSDLSPDEKLSEANASQIDSLGYGDSFDTLELNVCIEDLDLKIVNKSKTLPSFQPITKYKAQRDPKTRDLKIDTESTELYIPPKGYGQALFGEYRTPENCAFMEGIFFSKKVYDSNSNFMGFESYTVNKEGEKFILVDKEGKPYEDRIIEIPCMVYKTFSQADSALPLELATASNENYLQNILFDLSNFEITNKTISCEELYLLGLLPFTASESNLGKPNITVDPLDIYEIFQSNIKVSCKVCYSELPKDEEAKEWIDIIKESSNTDAIQDFLDKIGYTRSYNNLQIPSNLKYKLKNGTYSITNTGLFRDLNRYSADSQGNLLYLDTDGSLVTEPTLNKDPVCAVRTVSNVKLFNISNRNIEALVSSCFFYTKNCILHKKQINSFEVTLSENLGSILAIQNPNKATSIYNSIQDITQDENAWSTTTKFKFNFKDIENLQIDLVFTRKVQNQTYNFAFLKSNSGEVIAKVFFKTPITDDHLLIFQKEQ